MRSILINANNEGSKILRLCQKLMPKASLSFFYKMFRKKNITINGNKIKGNEELKNKDCVKFFFSEETFESFGWIEKEVIKEKRIDKTTSTADDKKLDVIYEDENIILVNKPLGILSQKADIKDYSMIEAISDYLIKKGTYNPLDSLAFKPAIANRLDRNTSGILAAGKSIKGLKYLSEGFKNRRFDKSYLCMVKGLIIENKLLNGLWSKESHGNKVTIKDVGWRKEDGLHFPKEYWVKGNIPVQTAYSKVLDNGSNSLIRVELLTGKSHQIRAHMALDGHPLAGDFKYGDKTFNNILKKKYSLRSQLLHAYYLYLPEKGHFFAEIPKEFVKVLKGEELWELGIQEAFEEAHWKN